MGPEDLTDDELSEAFVARNRMIEQEEWDETCRGCACFGDEPYENGEGFRCFSCAAGVDIEPQQWEDHAGEPTAANYPARCKKFNSEVCG
jgi:hypothetical protein